MPEPAVVTARTAAIRLVRRRRRPILLALLVVTVLVVLGAGLSTWVIARGDAEPQPSDALPADTLAYVGLDLNPTVQQKMHAGLLGKLPGIADVGAQLKLAESVFAPALRAFGWFADVDYSADFGSWVGSRMALAARPNAAGTGLTPMLVIATTNEAAARATLANKGGLAVGFTQGFAVVTTSQGELSRTLADVKKASLHGGRYASDLQTLGDPGVITGWVDGTQPLAPTLPAMVRVPPDTRVVTAVRLAGSGLEVALREFHVSSATATASTAAPPPVATTPGPLAWSDPRGLKNLSGNTLAAAASTDAQLGLHDALAWNESAFPDVLGPLASGWGGNLVNPVTTIAGKAGLLVVNGDPSSPTWAARTVSDPSAEQALAAFPGATVGPVSLIRPVWQPTSDGVMFGSSVGALSLVSDVPASTRLGDDWRFASALPKLATAQSALYVNLAVEGDYLASQSDNATARAWLTTFARLGVTAQRETDGVSVLAEIILR